MSVTWAEVYRRHAQEYAARRLGEIKQRHYPDGDTIQMIADFEWLMDEAEYLRGELAKYRGTRP